MAASVTAYNDQCHWHKYFSSSCFQRALRVPTHIIPDERLMKSCQCHVLSVPDLIIFCISSATMAVPGSDQRPSEKIVLLPVISTQRALISVSGLFFDCIVNILSCHTHLC